MLRTASENDPRSLPTGLILAGGASSRFGSDKAVFRIRGRRMIDRVYDALATVCGEMLLATGSPAHQLDVDATPVYDAYQGAGPLAGLHAGLRACRTDWLLVCSVDLPYVTASTLRSLLDARSVDVLTVVARSSDCGVHPLCACYHRDLLPVVTRRLDDGTYSMRGLVSAIAASLLVEVPERDVLNVNRPGDLQGF